MEDTGLDLNAVPDDHSMSSDVAADPTQGQQTNDDHIVNTTTDAGGDDDEELPEGWRMVQHKNGLSFFYHSDTGVVSWSKPYVRRYDIEVQDT